MKTLRIDAVCLGLALAAFGPSNAFAQGRNIEHRATTPVARRDQDFPVVPNRVVDAVDETRLVSLTGNTHPLAQAKYEKGRVDPQLKLDRMVLVLHRSPEQEAALKKIMDQQTDPKSPNYHHWLEPDEFGRLYGPSDDDVAAVTNWLQNHGFQIDNVTKGRVDIEFSGTAKQVEDTFHLEMHRYSLRGVDHIANSSDPQIPEALSPVITGVASLHDFFPKHQSVFGGYVKKDLKTGKFMALDDASSGPSPEFVYTSASDSRIHNDVTPYDFATIYNVLPLWTAGIDGTGETIAISAVSDILQTDINTFRSSFGLPASTVTQIVNGTDPGVLAGAQIENTLDAEWSGAVAKGAKVTLVITKTTATTFGGQLSDSYIVDNKTAKITSASYGECEAYAGATGNAAFNSIYQQGAAEGISMFVSSGDQGSTQCDTGLDGPDTEAQHGLQVNGWASPPYITAVGGTDFNDYYNAPAGGNSYTTYWNSSNTSNGASAKGHIPELPWNSTCTSTWLLFANPSFGDQNGLCAGVSTSLTDDVIVSVVAGSGGKSSCLSNTGTFASCSGAYAKPSWQNVTGVPADGVRDVPDVSLFAAGGWAVPGIVGSAYLLCVSAQSPSYGCDYSNPSEIIYQEVGGTSVSSPAMAGIMALVLQKMSGAAQGVANPILYKLFSKETLSNCNSSTVGNGSTCSFYDITQGSNAMVCVYGSINCVTESGYALGVVTGYSATVGYDLATGLGSVNAANLVNGWASAAGTPAVSLTPTSLTFASTAVGVQSAAQTVTVKNTGTGTLTINSGGITFTGTDPTSFVKTATTCGSSLSAGSTCTISVAFKPAATGTLTASLAVADNASGSPQKVTLTGTGAPAGPAITLGVSSISFPITEIGSTSAAVEVTVKNTGGTTATITSIALGGTNPTSFLKLASCGSTLSAGSSCAIYMAFKPTVSGALTATLSLTDNAPGSPQKVTLTGTGSAVDPVTLSATTLAFGTITHGTTSGYKSVTVKNTGTAILNIASITISGTNPTDFIEITTCGTTLAPSASCSIIVAFKPAAVASYSATINITDNGASSPQKVTLTGTGD